MSLRAAGFIVFRRRQQIEYLLLQASYSHYHWTPPKGHVDPGEDDLQTAYRETEEEASLKPDALQLVKDFKKVLQYEVKGKPKTVIYWLAEVKDPSAPVKLSEEHQAFRWLPVEEACKMAAYQDMQELLREAEEFLTRS